MTLKQASRPRMHLIFSACLIMFAVFMGKISWACACCSDTGQWSSTRQPWDPDLFSADRYLNASVSGVGDADACMVFGKETDFTVSLTNEMLILSAKKDKNKKIYFHFPKQFEERMIDTDAFVAPQRKDRPNGPILYKELVLRGKVVLSQGNSKSTQPIEGTLVYQGAGNSCTDYTEFKSWFLYFPMENDFPCLLRSKLKN